ncbi:MAG: hypothetical protein AB7T49_13980 [Oligoflexales bacterium]
MDKPQKSNEELESAGWLQLALIMFLFPVLFFLCVYFPIWIGVASPVIEY